MALIIMAAAEQPQENELERLLKDYQMVQDQLRSMAIQLEQLQAQKIDMERAKLELDKSTGKVYIGVGGVIVETSKEKALSDIKERAELNEARLQSANKQYTDLRGREKQMNERITRLYRQSQGASGAA